MTGNERLFAIDKINTLFTRKVYIENMMAVLKKKQHQIETACPLCGSRSTIELLCNKLRVMNNLYDMQSEVNNIEQEIKEIEKTMEIKTTTIENIKVNYPAEMEIEEVMHYVKDQKSRNLEHKLVALDIELDGSEVVLRPHYDTIVRIRRITGYLSTIPRFNDAKKAEAKARVKHI